MVEGFTSDLIIEASFVAVMALLIAWHDMPLILAAPTVLLRILVPVLYFAFFCDGSWFMIDDINYFNDSATLLNAGFNPISVLITTDGLDELYRVGLGHHILYQWWNVLAMYFFGEHYYAAVLLNVLLTFCTGFVLNRTAELMGFSRNYRLALQLFFLLHWDVITWSSFVNLKECLVQLLTAAGIYFILRFCLLRNWSSVVGFGVVVQLFYWVRFYLSALMLISTIIWAIWQWRDSRKWLLAPLACAGMYLALLEYGDANDLINVRSYVYGFCVMLLAPLPWVQVDDIWAYMTVAAVFHFIFLLPAARGAWQLWQANRVARLMLIYAFVAFSFYAICEVDGMRGNRQRVQLVFILAWMQFQFLWSIRPAAFVRSRPADQPVGRLRPLVQRRPLAAPV